MAGVSDPVRLEVLKNALEGIADGMAVTLVRTSRSVEVRHGLDFSTGLLCSHGELVGQSFCMPFHMGGMPPALQACLKQYGEDVEPGDIFVLNDPYEGGGHLPDIFLFKPLFIGHTLVAYLCAMTHHADIGGRSPGGNACDSTEIYQEGLRIPALKLYRQGEPNETLLRLLEKAVRVPEKVLGDLDGQLAALHYGERELIRLAHRYGVADLLSDQEKLLDYTEELTRRAIRTLPDGEWRFTDYVDDDGFSPDPLAIVVNLAKTNDQLFVDLTGTSPQCKGAIQPMFATARGVVYAVVKTVLGGDIPATGGYFRPITVTAPPGIFLNPLPPAPCAARGVGNYRLSQTVFGAFAQMLPHRVFACYGSCELGVVMAGNDRTKASWKAWVFSDYQNETAWGGSYRRDGFDGQGSPTGNQTNISAEVIESEHPVQIEEYSFGPDSEGAGKFRGGLGMIRAYRYLTDETTVQMRSDRMKHSPYGLYGGHPSRRTKITIVSRTKVQSMPSKFLITLNKGDAMRVEWPGGGGWGNPLERDPALVLRDLREEKITTQRAREVYGVVVDVEGRRVDTGATKALRSKLIPSTKGRDMARVGRDKEEGRDLRQ